jgi:hypothetical protein
MVVERVSVAPFSAAAPDAIAMAAFVSPSMTLMGNVTAKARHTIFLLMGPLNMLPPTGISSI